MTIINTCSSPLSLRFFTPIAGIAASCPSARSCPELSDDAWLRVGITRTLEDEPSGRAFFQTISTDRKKEHDMRTLKRQSPGTLRCGTPAGTKVMIVWDKALNGEQWQVLSNELTLPPGLLVKLYLMRWDIEPERSEDSRPLHFKNSRQKVYDEFKNKFMEKKAWASSATAKCMQAVFLCLTHNLMVLQEESLRVEHGITNEAEDRRRAQRLAEEKEAVHQAGRVLTPTPLREALQRCTQRTVKFVRWLRSYLLRNVPWTHILAALRKIYSTS